MLKRKYLKWYENESRKMWKWNNMNWFKREKLCKDEKAWNDVKEK